mgnify:FL=1
MYPFNHVFVDEFFLDYLHLFYNSNIQSIIGDIEAVL